MEYILQQAGYDTESLKEAANYINDNNLTQLYQDIIDKTQILTKQEQDMLQLLPNDIYQLSESQLDAKNIQLNEALSQHAHSDQLLSQLKTLQNLSTEIQIQVPLLKEIDTLNSQRYYQQQYDKLDVNINNISQITTDILQNLSSSQNFTALQPNLINSIKLQTDIAENVIKSSENVDNLKTVQKQQQSIEDEVQRIIDRISAQNLKRVENNVQIQVYSAISQQVQSKFKTESDLEALICENQELYGKFCYNMESFKKLNTTVTESILLKVKCEVTSDQGKILKQIQQHRQHMLKFINKCQQNVSVVSDGLMQEYQQIEALRDTTKSHSEQLRQSFETLQNLVQRILYLRQAISASQQSPLFSMGLESYFENFGSGETLNAMLDYVDQFCEDKVIKKEDINMSTAELLHNQAKQIEQFRKISVESGELFEGFPELESFARLMRK
ncbi:hypothetical protein SS50377_22510 [Spironucleus salmonicida]|uniref:Uncharacterized protein n=1 Tax=Spironucleus salmonicida TaxID=348837 RepID=V6LBX5_9EUKA|nr:hypothetical protein SS50377_22510 [Spironucleus salmonicida]|eukprot:EST42000.1 Hypothetical protein SS50377_18305 [Spironucleus salmonicida]